MVRASALLVALLLATASVCAFPELAPAGGAGTATLAPSSISTQTPPPVVRMQDDDLSVKFAGAWSTKWRLGSSGATHRTSKRSGSFAKAWFKGTRVAFVARRGPSRGKARIYIDGVEKATVDLYAAQYRKSEVVWTSSALPNGWHTIKVVVLGKKRSASKGTVVVVDAFDVTGSARPADSSATVLDSDTAKLAKTGKWRVSTRSGALGGDAWRSSRKGAAVTVRFKGTGVEWIGRKDPRFGKAEVIVDGKRVDVVSQYAPTPIERRVAWSISGLPKGEHTVTIRVLGKPSASGGGSAIDVDSFRVTGRVLKAYRPSPFKYPWNTYIVVDKSKFRLYWVRDGLLIKSYPIAHGRVGASTPSRVWKIKSKYRVDPRSVYGPRKMRLYRRHKTSGGFAYEYTRYLIHGTDTPPSIGTRASAGCIRMYNKDVLELWPQVPVGTMVVTRD